MAEFCVAVLCLGACVLAASAAAKLRGNGGYQLFRAGLRETALLPDRVVPAASAVLLAAEALTAVSLAVAAVMVSIPAPDAQPVAMASLAAAVSLAAVLTCGVAAIMRRGTQARCACFGAGSGRPLGRVHLIRDLALLAILVAGLSGIAVGPGHRALVAQAVAAAAGLLGGLVIIRWEELAALFAAPSLGAGPAVRAPGRGRR